MADSILVLGATGTIGQLVVSELVTKGETVKAAALDGQAHPDAEILRFDFRDPTSIAPLFEGVSRVFVLMPSAPLDVIAALMPVMRHVVDRKIKAVLLSTVPVALGGAFQLMGERDFVGKAATPGQLTHFMRNCSRPGACVWKSW